MPDYSYDEARTYPKAQKDKKMIAFRREVYLGSINKYFGGADLILLSDSRNGAGDI
jgi:hypothetical protein